MEYKDLHDSESGKNETANARIAILQKSIIGQRKTLEALLKAQERNPEAFNGQVGERIERKRKEIEASEEAISSLKSEIRSQRGLISAVARFNPCRRQADRQVVQDNFYFAPGEKWLQWNSERRRRVGKGANSRFKTFQDIFTPPNYRIITKPRGAYRDIDFDDLPLDPVIVDPERISDTFISEFHNPKAGITRIPKGKHGLDSLRMKEGMIPAVKRFFQTNAIPVSRTVDSRRLNYRVIAVQDYSPEHDGKLIIPHYDTSEKPDERRKVMSIFDSAYSARRMTMKLYPGYEDESKQLYQIKQSVKEAWDSLIHVKVADENYPQVIADAKNLLREALDTLGKPVNSHKRSAYERLLSSTEITDIQGRLNKGATAAKLVSVCSDIFSRIEEADQTSIAGPQDQNTISGIINTSEILLLRYKTVLEQGSVDIASFEKLKGSLQKLKVRPFNIYAGKLMDIFRSANTKHGEGKREELQKALAVTRMFAAHKLVEDMLTSWDVNPETASKKFTYSLIQELYVAGFEPQFDIVKEAVRQANALTSDGIPENPDDVREILKGIDFEKLLEGVK